MILTTAALPEPVDIGAPLDDAAWQARFSLAPAAGGDIRQLGGGGNAGAQEVTVVEASMAADVPASSRAQVFIASGANEAFSAAVSGLTIFGGANREVVTLLAGVSGVTLDQNIERFNLPGTSGSFLFKQAGNRLQVFDSTGTTLLVAIPIQGDADGTQVGFANGTYDAKFASGRLLIGGTTVDATTPAALTPTTPTATAEPVPAATSGAKVYMAANDTFTAANNGINVFGNSGLEMLTVAGGTAGVRFDQNTDRVAFPGAVSNYTFLQTGNQINVYDAAGTTMLARGPVQGDADGTLLTFANGTGSVQISAGVMRLGGTAVSTTTPAPVSSSVLGAGYVAVTGAGSSSAGGGNYTYTVSIGDYTYTIAGFGAGDRIVGPGGSIASVINPGLADGTAILQFAAAGQVASIFLTGLTNAQDSALQAPTDFNTVFGSNTFDPGLVPPPTTPDFTTSAFDNLTGTGAADVFHAQYSNSLQAAATNTLSPTDKANGLAGSDRVILTATSTGPLTGAGGTVEPAARISGFQLDGIELLELHALKSGGGTRVEVGLGNVTGLQTVMSSASTADIVLSNPNGVVSLDIVGNGVFGTRVTLDYPDALLVSLPHATAQWIRLDNFGTYAAPAAVDAEGLAAQSITTDGAPSVVSIGDMGRNTLTDLSLSLGQDLAFVGLASTVVDTLRVITSAPGDPGALRMDLIAAVNPVSVSCGAGADSIRVNGSNGNSVVTYDGNDTVVVSASTAGQVQSVMTGAGNDLVILNGMRAIVVGGAGSDDLTFSAGGSILEAGALSGQDDASGDTLWLTSNSLGQVAASKVGDVIVDGVIRLDLAAGRSGGLANASGYGGADALAGSGAYTADQSNYYAAGSSHLSLARDQVQDFDNVIATGLGRVDASSADVGPFGPELANLFGYDGSLDLRGTYRIEDESGVTSTGDNVLYASRGYDVIEGRTGNDSLSGGAGVDTFVFGTMNAAVGGTAYQSVYGDGVDVIWRQRDNGQNLWSGFDNVTGKASGLTSGTPLDGSHNSTLGLSFQQDFGQDVQVSGTGISSDQLQFKAYQNRAANVAVNDNGSTGTAISLGVDSYAQDRVVSFKDNDGTIQTRIAEDQQYAIRFANLATQDAVKIAVNGVEYALTVGLDLNGAPIVSEIATAAGGAAATQAEVQANFLWRLLQFINSFMDRNTAAGQVHSMTDAATTLYFTQASYGASPEQTVFMNTPVVSITRGNLSAGAPASVTVTNQSQQEILLFGFDGRLGSLSADDVKFVGSEGVNRSLMATAKLAGGQMVGVEAAVIDAGARDLADFATNTTNYAPAGTTPQAVAHNAAASGALAGNFAVHGDDLLIGGPGNDAIYARTGDDRVIGSGGIDVVDGGGNWYAVQVQGEAGARVVEMNAYEARDPANRGPASLRGQSIVSTTAILQTQDGVSTGAMIAGTVAAGTLNTFADTLQFQQADFGANARFTITVNANDFSITSTGSGNSLNRVVNLINGGAGTVAIDANGDGVPDAGQITRFTNFENVRTVSGTGAATAGRGQGNDTLDVSALSAAVGGVRYELSDTAGAAGLIAYSQNVHASTVRPVSADYETPLYNVDGVEHVIGGTGNDCLIIDETEAAKNNSFAGGPGYDSVDYQNRYDPATVLASPTQPATDAGLLERAAQPAVTIQVDVSADFDLVTMTGGRIGATGTPWDALTSVEYILLNGNTARGALEADTLDVRAMSGSVSVTGGAIVDYTNGQVRLQGSVAAGGTTPATPTATAPVSGLEVTIGNIAQIEKVVADGDDTVIVASAVVAWTGYGGTNTMGANATTDDYAVAANRRDLGFATFLDFDELRPVTVNNVATVARVPFASLTVGANSTGNWNPAVTWAATLNRVNDWMNQGQFTFDLGVNGTDTVDYSQSLDSISVRVETDATQPNQYVLVDAAVTAADRAFDDNGGSFDRVDVLTRVGRIVAAQGESILDLTQSGKGLTVEFADFSTSIYQPAYDRDVYTVRLLDPASGLPLARTFLEFRDRLTSAVVNDDVNTPFNVPAGATLPAIPTSPTATWSRIEGSDFAEYVMMNGAHSTDNNVLNLRGSVLVKGDATPTALNRVDYNELTRSINTVLSVTDWDAGNPLATGLITAVVNFQNGSGGALPGGGTHTITSYAASNGIAAGALRLDASQDAEDTVSFAGGTQRGKTLVLAEQGIPDDRITVKFAGPVPGAGTPTDSVILTGYERLIDPGTNDAYDVGNLNRVHVILTLLDPNGNADHDAIIVHDDAAPANFTNQPPDTISLVALSSPAAPVGGGFGLAFDVLDITKMTGATSTDLTVIGNATGTDELVVGALSRLKAVIGFESLVLTQDTVASNGAFRLNLDNGSVTQGATLLTMPGVRTISAGGLALENTLGRSYAAAVASAVNLVVTDTAGLGATLVGGGGADALTGAAGSDALYGGAGADTLYAGIATEFRQMHITGAMSAATGGSVSLTFNGYSGTLTTVTEGVEIANGAGNDAVGAALAAKINAHLAAINVGAAWANGASLAGASYDAAADLLTFTFDAGVDVTGSITARTVGEATGNSLVISAESVHDGSAGGNNAFRGGAGADSIYGGAGADNMIIVGSVSAAQATAYAALYPTQASLNAQLNAAGAGLVNLSELTTAHTTSDVSGSEVIDGGAGIDELDLFGVVDMTRVALTGVEMVSTHSTVKLTAAQLDALQVLNLDDGASITVSDATDLNAAIAALQSVSTVRIAAGSAFKLGFGSTAPTAVDLAALLTNVDVTTIELIGAQAPNPGGDYSPI